KCKYGSAGAPGEQSPGATRPGTPPAPGHHRPAWSHRCNHRRGLLRSRRSGSGCGATKKRKGVRDAPTIPPKGYIDEYLNVAGIAEDWKSRGFGSNGTGFYGLVGLAPETASVCRTDARKQTPASK